MDMRASWAVPVIASILILGTLGLAQEAFAAIDINRLVTIDPILKPMNFTVANTGKNPITVTGITIFVDQDPTVRKVQAFTFDLNTFLKPLESFIFDPILTINDDGETPVALDKKTLVSVTAEEVPDSPRGDPEDPKDPKKIKAKKKI